MNSSRKNILLISYVFPPYYGIGGRRWAKHSLELTKLGYTVHVICANNPFDKVSLWDKEVSGNANIIVHKLPAKYPRVLVNFEHSFFQKLQYKFWSMILPMLTKGSIYDRTIFWKKTMLKKANELITQNNIKHVICTGGPFGVLYDYTLLKKKHPNIFLFTDLRDPWTWGPNWGYRGLDEKRMKYEKHIEKLAFENADLITVPTGEMVNYLNTHYPQVSDKVKELAHFFDTSELSAPVKTSSDKIRFVYYGNIYQDIDNYLEVTARIFGKHKDKLTFDIYTDKKNHIPHFEKHGATNVVTHPQESAKSLFQKFGNYDFVFILTPAYGKHNISTKFFEILYSKTPILLVSEEGLAGEFLEKNKLGKRLDETNLENFLLNLYTTRDFQFNDQYDLSKYNLSEIAKQIDSFLIQSN